MTSKTQSACLSPYQNEPFTDFTVAANRTAFATALKTVADRIRAGHYRAAPIINGQVIPSQDTIASTNPADPSHTIGTVHLASSAMADEAMRGLIAAQPGYARTPVSDRAQMLIKLAALMRADRLDLAALIVFEAGKPWPEADADVAEAIDFCEYYARQMITLGTPFRTQDVPGEENIYSRCPRGISVVIPPWNFPLAIACGMVVASLVTGNATLLKPAEQTSIIAAELARLISEAGVPSAAFAFLPGRGEEVGRYLVRHPRTDLICFTGSRAVGLEILKNAAEVQDGQRNIKRVIAELSGKNAIIVDADADLDESIKAVLKSTFGYAGQKCSACSRAIIVADAYEPFMKRLIAAASDMIIGIPEEPATFLGPVIDTEAQQRIQRVITAIKAESTLVFEGTVPKVGSFVAPTIFGQVSPQHRIWREEIFGPVLACTQARDFDHALELANDCSYALTGGVMSRSPSNLVRASQEFECGNLYLNRGCTGALVGRQPFGGYKLSGCGAQAGGPDYLIQFMHSRMVTENTLHRGFAPE